MTGVDFKDYLRTTVLDPMGLDHFWVGLPEELQPSFHCSDIVNCTCCRRFSPLARVLPGISVPTPRLWLMLLPCGVTCVDTYVADAENSGVYESGGGTFSGQYIY